LIIIIRAVFSAGHLKLALNLNDHRGTTKYCQSVMMFAFLELMN
jgi:hypothetical protein